MQTGTLSLSRWVLGLEMLVCFVPLSLLFVTVVAVTADGIMPARDGLLYLSAAAAGPIGLIAAVKMTMSTSTALDRTLTALLGIAAAWTVLAFCLQAASADMAQSWREFVLIALLPAAGAAHLAAIAGRREARRAAV